ncbi:MAG TPA: L,D-transpeptidase [Pseudolabrys sp.]|jgi:lipoprotein-anchoring transpeptidase ErfK/SrfK|nr:L,D-transpeptidase [Pseudolabrys sp.]
MIRNFGGFLLVLPATAVLFAGSAEAQLFGGRSSSTPAPAVTEEQLPPPSFGTESRYDDRGMPGRYAPATRSAPMPLYDDAADREAGALPPPGLPAQDGRAYGHQFGGNDPDAVRPPGAVGAAPPAAVQAPATQPRTAAVPGNSADAVPGSSVMTLPPEDQPETGTPKELPANLKKQLVDYVTKEPAGTIIVDTPNTYLYLVLGHGKAMRYGIGVGREGFTWAGTERVSRMKEWPDWFPPAEMIERQPYLPRMMAGGPGNPLGARALYLGHTLYRIHGTNQPSTIGQTVSSGCIRLLNEDIEDLFSRVQVGTRVVVLPAAMKTPEAVASTGAGQMAQPQLPPGGASVNHGALPPIR